MSTSDKLYGGCANIREFLVAPVTSMDTPIENNYFSYPELDTEGVPTGVILYHSIRSHIVANPNRKALYSKNGLYFYYGMASSDLKNDTKDLKTFAKGTVMKLKLGTEDFTAVVGDEFWVLNLLELEEWIKVTPHNTVEEPIV